MEQAISCLYGPLEGRERQRILPRDIGLVGLELTR